MKTITSIITIAVLSISIQVFAQDWRVNNGNISYDAGNVGIGIAQPTAPLHIKQMITSSGNFDLRGKNHEAFIIESSTRAKLSMDANDIESNHTLSINAHVDKHVTIVGGGGKLGVGTIFPTSRLTVFQTKNQPEYGFELMGEDARSSLRIYLENNDVYKTRFYMGNHTTQLVLNAKGNVGIGTDDIPDGYKLAVDGKVIAEEVKVQLSNEWPDYVFDSSYDLRSLDEVESFISRNSHLPDVPSAATVASQGIAVGEMQSILLRKIEELTLYTIALEKKVTALESSVNH